MYGNSFHGDFSVVFAVSWRKSINSSRNYMKEFGYSWIAQIGQFFWHSPSVCQRGRRNNSLFCDKYKYQPLIGLLYFLSMSEHLKPMQALFCSNASQGGLPGEGCWTMTRVLDWTPLPQLLSQLDHSDHAESWQSTTAKNNHTWWITWELTHLAKIYKKSAIWLLGTIPWFALKACFIFWEIHLWTDQS